MCQAVLSPNLTKKFQWEVSQIADNRFPCVMLLGGLSVNLNHLKIKEWRIPPRWLISPCLELHPHFQSPILVWNPTLMSGTPSPCQEFHPMSGTPSPCQEIHPHVRNSTPMPGTPPMSGTPPLVWDPIPMSGTPTPCLEPHPNVWNATKCPLHLKRKFGFFQVFWCSFQSYLTWVQSHLVSNNIFHLAWKNSQNSRAATPFPSIRYLYESPINLETDHYQLTKMKLTQIRLKIRLVKIIGQMVKIAWYECLVIKCTTLIMSQSSSQYFNLNTPCVKGERSATDF